MEAPARESPQPHFLQGRRELKLFYHFPEITHPWLYRDRSSHAFLLHSPSRVVISLNSGPWRIAFKMSLNLPAPLSILKLRMYHTAGRTLNALPAYSPTLLVTAFKSRCYRCALKHRAVKSPPTGLTLLTGRGEFQRWSSCFRASRALGLQGFVFVFVFQARVVRLHEPELSVHLIRLNPRSRLTLAAIWSSDGSSVPARKLK